MDIPVPNAGPAAAENPWRTVLEFQLGSGPNLREGRWHRDQSLVFGLASGITIGLTVSVAFLSFLYWMIR